MIEGLKIYSIKFKFPDEKQLMFFSWEDDKFRKSTMIKSRVLVPAEVDFQNQDNEDFVKMYYRRKLMEILSKHPELISYPSDSMSDIRIGKLNTKAGKREVCYKGHTIGLWEMELFTLMIRIDRFNNSPVIIDTNVLRLQQTMVVL